MAVLSSQEIFDGVEEGSCSPSEAIARLKVLDGSGEKGQENREARLQEIQAELDQLIGLREVKKMVREICAFVEVRRWRVREGLAADPLVMHMIFRGNPGTGKTTVARILGDMFREMGVLPKGHLVEVERADLVGEYIGHTAQKVREQTKKALGGILFIDEAYSLARGGEKDFGKEAIDTLVKAMEDHKDELVLILAGYRDEMADFLQSNPGLFSRFPVHLDFPDYTLDELMRIADLMITKRDYGLDAGARASLYHILADAQRTGVHQLGNARMVRNLIEKSIRKQAVRLVRRGKVTRADLMTLVRDDFM